MPTTSPPSSAASPAASNLSFDEMSAAIDAIMRGEWTDEQIGLLLTGLAAKGETVDEIAGAAAGHAPRT